MGIALSSLRNPGRSSQRQRDQRAWFLVLASLLAPGSAQISAGSRFLGRTAIRIALGIAVVALVLLVLFFTKREWFFAPFTQSTPLLVICIGLLTIALCWVWLILDAWRLGYQGRPSQAVVTGSALLALVQVLVTAGPLTFAANMAWTARDTLGTVFTTGSLVEPANGRYNILLIGGDAGEGRRGLRNDTNILLSVNAKTGAIAQVAIPRNLASAPFPKGTPVQKKMPRGFRSPQKDNKFNAIYKYGIEHPTLFPGAKDVGAAAVKQATSGVTGLDVQYYVMVDLHGFEAMIDALGGVEVDVHKRVPKAGILDKKVTAYIEPGRQRLNGADALWFARSRYGSDDYERMTRQRCVMKAAMNQLDPMTVLTRYRAIAKTSPELVSTDLPQDGLAALAKLALASRSQPVQHLALTPPLVRTGRPNYPDIRKRVGQLVAASDNPGAAGQPAPKAAPKAAPKKPAPKKPAPQPGPQDRGTNAICSA